MTTTTFKNGPLKTLVSCRVRLDDDERQALKASYRDKRQQQLPAAQPVIKGSSIAVNTNYGGNTDIDKKLGLDSILVSDVLNSRETLSLLSVLQLQHTLEVPIITKQEFLDSCQSYWDYVASSVKV